MERKYAGERRMETGNDLVALFTRSVIRTRWSTLAATDALYLISEREPGGGNLPVYTFHLFVGKCAGCTSARGYQTSHKARVLLQEDSNSAHTSEPPRRGSGGEGRASRRKREKDRRNIKNTGLAP